MALSAVRAAGVVAGGAALRRTAAPALAAAAPSLARGMAIQAQAVKFDKHGAPGAVLSVVKESVAEDIKASEVLVRFLAAPISPSDLLDVEGWSDGKPGVAGNEGVAEVLQAGSGVSGLKKGDWVVPARSGLGTWRTHAVFAADDLAALPAGKLPVEAAATASVSPSVAIRLLSDFAALKEGDVIVQNNAASTVGQAVIQLAAARGIKTVNILRQRDDYEDVVNHFHGLGATLVVDEDLARTPAFADLLKDLPAPKLGLNSVGGAAATSVAKALGHGATMVTFGGMSRKPVTVPTSLLVSKDLSLRGFNLGAWLDAASAEDKAALFAEAGKLAASNGAKQLLAREPFADFPHALARAQEDGERKVVLVFE